MRLPIIAWLTFLAAAILEVAGDATVRKGMRGGGLAFIALGCTMLGTYGVVFNRVPWYFSRLLGVYVAVFATVSVLFGRFVLRETVPSTTWLGTVVIIVGGLLVQFGPSLKGQGPHVPSISNRPPAAASHGPNVAGA
jgi:drug/metabolite transporter superfamily protein YnfA